MKNEDRRKNRRKKERKKNKGKRIRRTKEIMKGIEEIESKREYACNKCTGLFSLPFSLGLNQVRHVCDQLCYQAENESFSDSLHHKKSNKICSFFLSLPYLYFQFSILLYDKQTHAHTHMLLHTHTHFCCTRLFSCFFSFFACFIHNFPSFSFTC